MGLKPLLACLLLSSLALAGCSDSKDDGGDASTSSSASRSSSAPSTVTARPNLPPTGSIAVSTPGGALPLAVNVTLTGSDPESGPLSWTLAFGDGNSTNGTSLPASVAHNYTAAGNFTLLYRLSDGTSDATYNATINVTAGAATNSATQAAAGEWTVGALSCPHNGVGTFEEVAAEDLALGADVTWGYFAVDAATWGATWTVLAEGTGPPAGISGVELDFYDTSGAYMEYNAGTLGTPFSGEVPENAGHAFVFPCSTPGSFTYNAAFV